MDKLLIMGINTRSIVNSAKKLDFEIYNISYFQTADFPQIENSISILNEKENDSTGFFENQYDPKRLLEKGEDFLEIVDYIILSSGITINDFKGKHRKYISKIIANKNISSVENKYKFYKKIKNKYLTPETFLINDIHESIEIVENNPSKKYIIKPISGSGGYDVNLLNKDTLNQLNFNNQSWIIQEHIPGTTISSSILSTKKKQKQITTSRLLTGADFNQNNYIYIGNITPLPHKKINQKIKTISEKLIKDFKLIGSNGIDYIIKNGKIYIIEINPRLQGTYECIENILNINLLQAHIEAFKNKLIPINKINGYSYKKIIYAKNKIKYKKLNIKNIYDIPHTGSITEKNEPLLTIIDKNKNLKKLVKNVDKTHLEIEKQLYNSN